MKKQSHGHRWTDDEIKSLMASWSENRHVNLIASDLNVSRAAVLKMVVRLRRNGIPLARRAKGHIAGRANKPWTQEEVEYLIRRREESETTEQIAVSLDRSWNAVQAMIQTLRREKVKIKMLGCGVRRLWSVDRLMESAVGRGLIADDADNVIPIDSAKKEA